MLRTLDGLLLGTSHNRATILDSRNIKSVGFGCNGVNNVFIDCSIVGYPSIAYHLVQTILGSKGY
jgi:hypothetical protein